jgi:hypothetical protein
MIPKRSFKHIIEYIKGDKECSPTPMGMWKCNCDGTDDKSFPTIKVRMGSEKGHHEFELKNVDYMYKI